MSVARLGVVLCLAFILPAFMYFVVRLWSVCTSGKRTVTLLLCSAD